MRKTCVAQLTAGNAKTAQFGPNSPPEAPIHYGEGGCRRLRSLSETSLRCLGAARTGNSPNDVNATLRGAQQAVATRAKRWLRQPESDRSRKHVDLPVAASCGAFQPVLSAVLPDHPRPWGPGGPHAIMLLQQHSWRASRRASRPLIAWAD